LSFCPSVLLVQSSNNDISLQGKAPICDIICSSWITCSQLESWRLSKRLVLWKIKFIENWRRRLI